MLLTTEVRIFNSTPAPRSLQTKTRLGSVNDALEREAGLAADAVVAGSTVGALSSASVGPHSKEANSAYISPAATEMASSSIARGGRPLSKDQRSYFEPRFVKDLSQVRLHSHVRAAESAKQINARAFTVQNNIGFATGESSDDTDSGRHLLAHELAHVVQQNDGFLRCKPIASKQSNPVPGLGPLRTETIDLLIKAKDFQGAVDLLVSDKATDSEINVDLLENKRMIFEAGLTSSDGTTSMPHWDYVSSPQKADPAKVKIGPSAFSSGVPYLYSVIMHEYQHVLWQQTLPNQKLSNDLHAQGIGVPDEVEAGAWEILHAAETGISKMPERIVQIWSNLNDAFWKLDSIAQKSERKLVEKAFLKAKAMMGKNQEKLDRFEP